MTTPTLNINFTERAAKLLPPGLASFRLQGMEESSQRQMAVGDRIRIARIDNCPWFVVSARYWDIGETTTLTLWLDEPQD